MDYVYSYDLLMDDGDPWSDFPDYWSLYQKNKKCFPQSIHIWYGQFLDKIQVVYKEAAMQQHGGSEPGGYVSFDFESGEYIVYASLTYMPFGTSEHMIRDFEVRTTKGKTYAYHSWGDDKTGAKCVEFAMPEGYALAAISGTTGYYDPSASCCIAGMTLYYSPINGTIGQEKEIWKEERLEIPGELEAVCLHTPDSPHMPASDKWVNTMVDLHAPVGCKLWCASVSSGAGQVAMPINVRTVLYDGSGKRVLESDKPQSRVRNYEGNFYQIYEENSGERKYRLHICMREDSSICMDMQAILSDLPVGIEEQLKSSGFPEGESGLPLFLRSIYQMDIVDQDPGVATLETGMSTSAIPPYWWFRINDVLAELMTLGVAAIVILGVIAVIAVIVWILWKGGSSDDIRKELQKEVNKKLPWGDAPAGMAGVYDEVEVEAYQACIPTKGDQFYTVDTDVLDFYTKIFNDNGKNVSVQTLKTIKDNQIKNKQPLVVDVGGEGCFSAYGINAGYKKALNFNGKYFNSQQKKKAIPMLIHFQDWNNQQFPLKEGIVDRFMMQSTGTPTFNQACEMIRCLRKGAGSRMDFWVTDDDGEKCYRSMANILLKYVEQGRKVSFKKWSDADVAKEYDRCYRSGSEESRVFSIIIE